MTPDKSESGRLKEIAARSGVADRVFFADYPPERMPVVYRALDLVLALSVDGEAFGRVPIEAGGYGTMSVVSDLGAFGETVTDGQTGILIPPTPQALGAALAPLLQSSDKREAIARRAAEEFIRRFSAVVNGEETFAVYRQLGGGQ